MGKLMALARKIKVQVTAMLRGQLSSFAIELLYNLAFNRQTCF